MALFVLGNRTHVPGDAQALSREPFQADTALYTGCVGLRARCRTRLIAAVISIFAYYSAIEIWRD